MVSCDADASGITWPKKVMLHLILIILWEQMQLFLWQCHPNHKGFKWPKNLCCTSFWLSWMSQCSSAIDDAIDITRCWCWCQWHQITKTVVLHLKLSILVQQMEWCHWWHCWHHMTLIPISMALLDLKHYIVDSFKHLDQMNIVIWCRFLILLIKSWSKLVISGTEHLVAL